MAPVKLPESVQKKEELGVSLGKRATRMELCGTELRVLVARCCGEVRTPLGAVPSHCHVRGCPRCDRARSVKMRRFLPLAMQDHKHQLRFFTVTVANVPRLEIPQELAQDGLGGNVLQRLSKLVGKLRRFLQERKLCERCHRWKRPRRSPLLKLVPWCQDPCEPCRDTKACQGRAHLPPPGTFRAHAMRASVRAIEVTFAKKTGWHPHCHMLADMPFTCQRALSDAWAGITELGWPGGRSPILDVRALYGPEDKAIKEVLKYPTKVADLHRHPERLAEFAGAAARLRFIQATGAWAKWQSLLDADDLDEPPDDLRELCCACGREDWIWMTLEVEGESQTA